MKEILAIGGYERDNFGDLLFFKVLQKFSEGKANVTPSSIIYSDMTDSLGEIVIPYDVALAKKKYDAIWVVGGEIGGAEGLSFQSGLGMDFQADAFDTYIAALDKSYFVNAMSARHEDSDQAYLPNLKNYLINKNTQLILNSVGIGGYDKITDAKVKQSTLEILRQSRINVRDDRSSKWLNTNNIKHTVSPDVVHVLPRYFPKKKRTGADYVLFQANAEYLRQKSTETVARVLVDIARETNMKISLFIAGTATGHDSVDIYREIKTNFLKLLPKGKIEIISEKDRDPISLAQIIANASLTVATSLHVRILSVAYSVPRVSLVLDTKGKIATYCRRWDGGHPVNSDLEAVIDDVKTTFNSSNSTRAAESKQAGDLAYVALESAFDSIKEGKKSSQNEINLLNETVKKYFSGVVYMQDIINQRDNQLHERDVAIEKLNQDIHVLSQKIEAIERSRIYKIGRGVTRPYEIIKRSKHGR